MTKSAAEHDLGRRGSEHPPDTGATRPMGTSCLGSADARIPISRSELSWRHRIERLAIANDRAHDPITAPLAA